MARLPSLLRFPTKLRRRARRHRMATLLGLAVLCVLLLSPFYAIYRPPRFVLRYFQHRWPDVLWEVTLPAEKKLVALTLDDAPSDYTREILALLKENDARATFFVIGSQTSGRESTLRDMVRDGHELGNHAMYDEAARTLSDGELEDQIRAVQVMLREAYRAEGEQGPPHQYFRPGSGFFSDRMRALLDRLGFRLVLGSIYPHDPQIKYWWLNARHILSMLRPGAIIVCHDRRSWTLPMLRKALPEMNRRGYRVVTVTELLQEADR
ncbi:Chitooligosaccharide deacetylase [Pleurostoma richardsiae]|uniref:chitin deacetylase n=1 Tax=Pleurostoma richardsiae TaxID=41990 RepID=A0AA38VFY8_9PEZI|nr:Chitooligosaccharide deacetylase [Pleurostoma richardsiae]